MSEERSYDFSVLNEKSLAFVIIRSLFALFVFLNPVLVLFVYLGCWVLDSLDDNIIEETSGQKILVNEERAKYNAYQLSDKIGDTVNTTIFVIWSVFFIPFYPILLILFGYRLIGVGVMYKTKKDELLVFFPNIVGYLLGVFFFISIFAPVLFYYLQYLLFFLILFGIVSILSLLTEIVAHIIKPKILERY